MNAAVATAGEKAQPMRDIQVAISAAHFTSRCDGITFSPTEPFMGRGCIHGVSRKGNARGHRTEKQNHRREPVTPNRPRQDIPDNPSGI
jgi:hypothetical protein